MSFIKAVVTGASSGIGEALTELLGQKNIPLLLTARSMDKLIDVEKELDRSVELLAADLTKPEERKELIDWIRENSPDLVINNAGFGLYGEALQSTTAEQMKILEINANAVLEITLEAARAMQENKTKGVIMNISSAASYFSFPSFATYAAAKAFVANVSQALDAEMSPHGIRVLTACPGQIDTPFRVRASKGRFREKTRGSLTPKKAAELIWKQIEDGKRISIFDWKTRWMVRLSHLIPRRFLEKILKNSVEQRI